MSGEQIKEFLGDDWKRMHILFHSALGCDIAFLQKINDSVASHTGKQTRPMVCLLAAYLCSGGANEDCCRYAASIELMHNATLMHDDVADESSERRGYPTISAMLGQVPAVLVGDYWLAKAVESIIVTANYTQVVPLFTHTLRGLAEGEMLQIQNAISATTTEDDYLRVIYCKTASLFKCAAVCGAISVKASDAQIKACSEYAVALGNAFQIKDDILDYTGTDALGKPHGADIKERKITLPLLGALRNRPDKESEIRKMVCTIPEHPEYAEQITDFVLKNGGVEFASSRLEEYIESAVRALDIFEDSQAKKYLEDIVRYNTIRSV